MHFIRKFSNLRKTDVATAGGKGASLGEMFNVGIPVPDGFVILASAFNEFLNKNSLIVEIDAAFDEVNTKEMHTIENASERIQNLILASEMPANIKEAILQEFSALGAEFVAVRSSATAEDSASAAWAGQLSSYLNTTKSELLINVKNCWASLFTPRAIFYRFAQGLGTKEIAVAVVVQKMIDSEKSGVAFSVHPVTQDRNQAIIEAGFGLGEAIVAGEITPDSYVVDKKKMRVLETNINSKIKALYRGTVGGNKWKKLNREESNKQVLNQNEIISLIDTIAAIEKHYGFPVDVEWAQESGRFYIVQSRPITTLITNKEEIANDLVRIYDLDSSSWTYKGFHGVLHPFFPVGRLGLAMKDCFGDGTKMTIFFVKDDYVHWYWRDSDLTRLRIEFFSRLKNNKDYLEEMKDEWKAHLKKFDQVIKKMDSTDLSELPDEELAGLYDVFYKRYIDEYRYFMALGDAISMHADRYLTPEFHKVLGNDFNSVFPKLITTKYLSFVEEESIERAKLLATLKKAGSVSQKRLEAHANRFFYILNNYAKGNRLTAKDFEKMLREDVKKRLEPSEDITKKLLAEKKRLIKKYKLSKWHQILLYVMDEFFQIQDTRKKYVLISNYYQFEFLREAERRTKIPFKLLQYSVYPEFRNVLENKINLESLKKRKELCACVHTYDSFEVLCGPEVSETLDFFQKSGDKDGELKGMVASTGKVTGRVKKILKVHDMANMEEGDVLVSSMTRPEMVPAMKLASAIITDEGGVTSHAAIVSRELKIPCIIGTKNATTLLKDGDLVEVDANKGIIKILKKK